MEFYEVMYFTIYEQNWTSMSNWRFLMVSWVFGAMFCTLYWQIEKEKKDRYLICLFLQRSFLCPNHCLLGAVNWDLLFTSCCKVFLNIDVKVCNKICIEHLVGTGYDNSLQGPPPLPILCFTRQRVVTKEFETTYDEHHWICAWHVGRSREVEGQDRRCV